ncbi:MAG: Nitrogenase (molybdenum-iron)-specific transcriptional regulator NifA [Candidatus Ozemobacter sibiricus]|uniref:Nitrogenase (Molybdenum-iron)-specific transcriptional regulator NifA n=1 Tax=Candidatus Ozemobacter sibiricus TaxID=2268124 RepID=A0A367ZLH2_9BACT|nr:MAG: Nitrogenase (molybdenum-iron)-specific transcriptional regulator NifA [Candidatus Ozemobacter sibiricus]
MKLDLLVVSERFAWVEEKMTAVLPATVEGVAWQIRSVKVKDIVPELHGRPDHVPVWLLEWSDRAPAREAFDIILHQSRSKGRLSVEGADGSDIPPLVLVLTRRPDDQSVRAIWQWSYPRLGAILYDQVLDKPAEYGGAGFLADLLAQEVRLRPHLRELENLPSEPICSEPALPVDQEPLFVTLGWGRAMQRFVADLRRLVAAMRSDWVKAFQRPPDLDQRIRAFLRRDNQQPLESLFGQAALAKSGSSARSDRAGKGPIELPPRPANHAPLHLLLTGETGTGKTLLARLVSDLLGARPMVSVNASGLSETLLEYELFGCKDGTATDVGLRPGYVLSALGGVLFFDEIGDIPLPLQARLLTFLDELKIRVNGFEGMTPPLPLYVIAATNQPLEEKIEKGQFRADLYQRFRLRIAIPSMAERKEDIPALVSTKPC